MSDYVWSPRLHRRTKPLCVPRRRASGGTNGFKPLDRRTGVPILVKGFKVRPLKRPPCGSLRLPARAAFSLFNVVAGMTDGADLEKKRSRAYQLFFERWREQLETSFAPRRARTLGAISALDELIALAEGYVRSGGSTRPAIDPEDAGHGVRMLPDVAGEATQLRGRTKSFLASIRNGRMFWRNYRACSPPKKTCLQKSSSS